LRFKSFVNFKIKIAATKAQVSYNGTNYGCAGILTNIDNDMKAQF